MDNIPQPSAPALPPVLPGATTAFIPGAQPPRVGQGTAGVVGRPSGDPVQQEERREQAEVRKRLNELLPAEMRDGRLAVYQLKGSVGRMRKNPERPVKTILLSQLEKAKSEGMDTSEYVRDLLSQQFTEGRFVVEAQDKRGRALPDYGLLEIDMDPNAVPAAPEFDEHENEHEEEPPPRRGAFSARDIFTPPPPPPGVGGSIFNPSAHAKELRDVLGDEKRAAGENMTLMMTMMQNSSAQMQQFMMLQQQQAEERRREEERREERRREEEAKRHEREERERDRREEREKAERQSRKETLLSLIPVLLPVVQKVMEGKPDTTTPLLFKMIEGKSDRDGAKELMALMGEASKQALLTQAESQRGMLNSQAEATKVLMTNMMGISKQMVEATLKQALDTQGQGGEGGEEEKEGTIEKMMKVFSVLQPAIGMLTQKQPAAVPAQVLPGQPGVVAAPQVQRPTYPPEELIKGGLYTIMNLETGKLPAKERLQALKWCSENLPTDMLDAIRAGDEGKVLEIGARGMDQELATWLGGDGHIEFLRDCISDVQRMLVGAMDQTAARASMQKHLEYMQAKNGGPAPQPAAPKGVRRAPPPPPAEPQMAESAEPTKPAEAPAAEAPKA